MITARDIIRLLRERHQLSDGWITMPEVTPPGCSRRFDLIAILGWESRGHEAQGFEVKVSRSDWLAELGNPAKAEPLARLCSRYWIVAPAGVVVESELPTSWGLLLARDKGLRAQRQAKRMECDPWSEAMWRCMLLRCATRESKTPTDLEAERALGRKEGKEDAEEFFGQQRERDLLEFKELREAVRMAEEVTGQPIRKWSDFSGIKEVMAVMHGKTLDRIAYSLKQKSSELRDAADGIDAAAASIIKRTDVVACDV